MRRRRPIVLGLLAGMLLTVGALAAPLLFAVLPDRALAGAVAGRLFQETSAVAVLLSLGSFAGGLSRVDRWLGFAPAGLLAINEAVLHPIIAAEKAAHGSTTPLFAFWHAVSGLGFALACAAALVAFVRALRAD